MLFWVLVIKKKKKNSQKSRREREGSMRQEADGDEGSQNMHTSHFELPYLVY